MKTKLINLLVLTIFVNTYAQFGPQQIITNNAVGARSVSSTDIDGNGHMDVLSADDYRVAWYKNTDGLGNFGSQQVIDEFGWIRSLDLADVDLDDDMDVISLSQAGHNKIAWWEMTDQGILLSMK